MVDKGWRNKGFGFFVFFLIIIIGKVKKGLELKFKDF